MRILRYFGFSAQSTSSLSTNLHLHLKRSSWKHILFVDLENIHKHIISINITKNPPLGPWTHVSFPWLRSLLNLIMTQLRTCKTKFGHLHHWCRLFHLSCNHVGVLVDFWYDQKIYLGKKKCSIFQKVSSGLFFFKADFLPTHPSIRWRFPHQLSQVESFDSKLSRSSWIRFTDQARFDGDADSHRNESYKTLNFMNYCRCFSMEIF